MYINTYFAHTAKLPFLHHCFLNKGNAVDEVSSSCFHGSWNICLRMILLSLSYPDTEIASGCWPFWFKVLKHMVQWWLTFAAQLFAQSQLLTLNLIDTSVTSISFLAFQLGNCRSKQPLPFLDKSDSLGPTWQQGSTICISEIFASPFAA